MVLNYYKSINDWTKKLEVLDQKDICRCRLTLLLWSSYNSKTGLAIKNLFQQGRYDRAGSDSRMIK